MTEQTAGPSEAGTTDEVDTSTEGDEGSAPIEAEPLAQARREAAKYRTRLREAEAEREGLRGRLSALQRAAVERMAGDGFEADGEVEPAIPALTVPADLWLAGVTVDGLLGEDGELDPSLVRRAIGEVLAARPTWAKRPTSTFSGGVRPEVPTRSGGWADVLRS